MITIEMNTRVIAKNDRGAKFEGILKGFTIKGDLLVMVDLVDIGHGWELTKSEILSFPRDNVKPKRE